MGVPDDLAPHPEDRDDRGPDCLAPGPMADWRRTMASASRRETEVTTSVTRIDGLGA